MDKIYVVLLILLYNIKDVGALCGHLTYQEPAIQGRNVTLVFRPYTFKRNTTVSVGYDKPGKDDRRYLQFPFDIKVEVYHIYVDTTLDDFNSSIFYVRYGGFFSNPKRLTLDKSEKRQTTFVDLGQTTIVDSGQTTIVESGHKASGNAFLHWIAAGFGGLVLLTATLVLTTYLRKRKKRVEKPGQRNDPNVAQYVAREESSTLSVVIDTEVLKPRTVMSNTEGAVKKSEEKTTGTLIYADLDIELLEAARRARKERSPSAPTEYVDIRFATRSQHSGQENIHAY